MITNDWNIPGNSAEIYSNIWVPAVVAEWVPRMLALASPQSGEKVLDIACGSGPLTRAAAKAVAPNGVVTGLDLSPDMLSAARTVSVGQFPNIEWREANAVSLPFEDQVFDVVFCQFGLMLMADPLCALNEMRRVLKPDGRIGLLVWGALEQSPGQVAMEKTMRKYFGDETASGLRGGMHSMGDPKIMRSLLETAGFRDIDVHCEIGSMRWPTAKDLVKFYGACWQIPADEPTRTGAIREVEAELQAYQSAEGLIYPVEGVLGRAIR